LDSFRRSDDHVSLRFVLDHVPESLAHLFRRKVMPMTGVIFPLSRSPLRTAIASFLVGIGKPGPAGPRDAPREGDASLRGMLEPYLGGGDFGGSNFRTRTCGIMSKSPSRVTTVRPCCAAEAAIQRSFGETGVPFRRR